MSLVDVSCDRGSETERRQSGPGADGQLTAHPPRQLRRDRKGQARCRTYARPRLGRSVRRCGEDVRRDSRPFVSRFQHRLLAGSADDDRDRGSVRCVPDRVLDEDARRLEGSLRVEATAGSTISICSSWPAASRPAGTRLPRSAPSPASSTFSTSTASCPASSRERPARPWRAWRGGRSAPASRRGNPGASHRRAPRPPRAR